MRISNQYGSVVFTKDGDTFQYTGVVSYESFLDKFLDDDTVNRLFLEVSTQILTKEHSKMYLEKMVLNYLNNLGF